jgi:5-hydroxyisourate hydrolase
MAVVMASTMRCVVPAPRLRRVSGPAVRGWPSARLRRRRLDALQGRAALAGVTEVGTESGRRDTRIDVYAEVYTLCRPRNPGLHRTRVPDAPPPATTPMGHLSTHVLDTAHGCPAAGMTVTLQRLDAAGATTLKSQRLNARRPHRRPAAGRVDHGRRPLPAAVRGGAYFRARGVDLPEPAFIDVVPLDFGIADAAGHYHVPLLTSPWSYSTYRGS